MKNSALNYALWLLSRRDRSIGQIEEKLSGKEYPSEEINSTIKFLCDKNFLSDERFAENFIRNQMVIKPLGKYQLKQKLQKKLVPADTIEKTLSGIEKEDELNSVKETARKWLHKQKLDHKILRADRIMYEKLCRHLASRGFGWDVIKEVLNKFDIEN